MSLFPKTTDNILTFTTDKTLTTRQKIIVSFACLPTNLGWALSESLIIPYLLMIGAPLYVCSWTWFFSPILASYVAPKIDELSDNWSTQNCLGWRGRKQLILTFTLISAITMILLPQSHSITLNLFSTNSVGLTFIIAMVTFTMMDISFYLLLRPLQSLIWDISCGDKDIYMDTMKIFNIVQGICRMSGLIIVAICISFDFIFFGTHIGSAFTLSAIIIIILTLFSLFYSPNPPEIDSSSLSRTTTNTIRFTSNISADFNQFNGKNTDELKHLLHANTTYKSTEINDIIHDDNEDDDEYDEYETSEDDIGYNYYDIDGDYNALFILWLSQLCGWCSMCSVVLFWTCFVSIDVYKGVANYNGIHDDKYEWLQFKAGLVFGAYGLLLTALVSVNCSVLYPWLRKRISTRILYLIGESGMGILCIMFYCTTNETSLLILISSFGVFTQIHMQSCLELTENELQPMFMKMRKSKTTKYFQYVMEICNVIAPVVVSLFGGPIVALCDGQFKYLWLFAGCIQLLFDFFVLLIFCNVFPWKLPRVLSSL